VLTDFYCQNNENITVLLLILHQALSKTPYMIFGGQVNRVCQGFAFLMMEKSKTLTFLFLKVLLIMYFEVIHLSLPKIYNFDRKRFYP
jgi:hypothetical protein